mgnify:CR=1 FL=1
MPKGTPWQQGQSGNPNGRPPNPLSVTNKGREYWLRPAPPGLVKEVFGKKQRGVTYGDCYWHALMSDACAGTPDLRIHARDVLYERFEGKVPQPLLKPDQPLPAEGGYADIYSPEFLARLITDLIKDGRATSDALARISPETGSG